MHVRPRLTALTIAAGLAAISTTAFADRPRKIAVYATTSEASPAAGLISNKIFINRCKDGCTFTQSSGGTSSSRLNQTFLGGDGDPGNPGSAAPGTVFTFPACGTTERPSTEPSCQDSVWADVLACVTDVYAPYDVVITETDPGVSVAHHEAIFAGVASNLGLNAGVGGVGPIDCGSLHEDTLSFSFDVWGTDIGEICSTIAQESGHGFQIEHSFNCLDAMGSGYVASCGPQFFRNETLDCARGDVFNTPMPCACTGAQQNVHQRLTEAFGANPIPLPAPVVTLNVPAAGATFAAGAQFPISGSGVLYRGMGRAEVWFNGYKWLEQNAMNNQTMFTFNSPVELPDGVIDIEIRIYNDLETVYGTQTITVTKGAPCADENSCAAGQTCDGGKCSWAPPSGQFGDACTYDQFCISELCAGEQCTSPCQVGISGFCPAGAECEPNGDGNNGYCISTDGGGDGGGGCCSVSDDGTSTGTLLAQLGLAGLVLGGLSRRRRRR